MRGRIYFDHQNENCFSHEVGFDLKRQTHIRAGEVLETGTRVASTYIIGWWLKRLGGRSVTT